jgi:hypothetical protein
MVDITQRKRQWEAPGLDVRKPGDFRKQQEARAMQNPHHPFHANRTTYTDDQGRVFERNMRGKDRYNINVGPRPERDTTGLGGLINRLDTGNIGYTDMLNSLFGSPGSRFNEEYSGWEDKFGDDYMVSGQPFISQDNISSERQPGLEEGIMGAMPYGEHESSGLWQDIKKILKNTKNPGPLIDQWTDYYNRKLT